jgi:N-acyl-D-amino-acid deacylase
MAWSLLIKNGTVIDGSGVPRSRADVAVEGDKIVAIGQGLSAGADRVIDATNLIVAPGFIDIHSHSDFFYEQCPSAESKVRQGVTTEVVGMCSFSPAPCTHASKHQVEKSAQSLGTTLRVRWSSFAEYLRALADIKPSVNVVHFVGHGPIRFAAMGGEKRPPSAAELADMKALLAEAMSAGAFGLSSGLIYPPSAYADTGELIALCRSMAGRGGQYFTHMRGEAGTLLTSIDEAVRISDEGGVPLQIAHLKAHGRENWPLFDRALAKIDAARARGLDASADVYPYAASSTFMTALLPDWVHDGGIAKLLERIGDPATRKTIVSEGLAGDGRWQTGQGTLDWAEVMVATCPDASAVGRTLADLAKAEGKSGADTMLDLLAAHQGAVSMIMFTQAEENVQKALRQPYVMIGSDSLGLTHGPGPHAGCPHPRMYGTFPRVLGKYARDGKLFSHEQAVAKMTGQPAAKLGLRNRGLVKENYFADLALFDPAAVRDQATFEDPHHYPVGIPYVIVNGSVVVDGGAFNARPAGRILGGPSAAH